MKNAVITLTTDFGLQDNYAGIIKGIISYLNPAARIIDISCDVPPFNVEAGSYILRTSYLDFPPGTIHLAIVDPGVGTKRRAILLETEDYFFLAPDNGVLSFLTQRQLRKVIALTNKKYFLKEISPTFHGRDIFAPVAAYLSLGISADEFGPKLKSINRPTPVPNTELKGILIGHLIYIDRFGNLVTSFRQSELPDANFVVFLNDDKIGRLCKTFGSVREGSSLCYINSFGYLEIGINRGSAAEHFDIGYSSNAKILIAPS